MITISPAFFDINTVPRSSVAAGELFGWADPNDLGRGFQLRVATNEPGGFVRLPDGAVGVMDPSMLVTPLNAVLTVTAVS